MALKILHTNDLHGRLRPDRFAFLSHARDRADLYFDTGDCIKTGNLGVPVGREEVWGLFQRLRCDASVIGNRETHVLEAAFRAKLAGATHPVLCANLHKRDGTSPLSSSLILERSGFKIGVFGVSVAMVTARMKTRSASAYLWDPPIETAVKVAAELRPQVDAVFALTHIGLAQDRVLAEAGGDIDVIFGGHSHSVLEKPELVAGTWICQGGSHARFFGEYVWDGQTLTGGLTAWA
ncbi:MAG: metallophosphoesterase [Armatimonadetes bacterium]|nr:metallophosphoesterase [Armatimonadota bacterium]